MLPNLVCLLFHVKTVFTGKPGPRIRKRRFHLRGYQIFRFFFENSHFLFDKSSWSSPKIERFHKFTLINQFLCIFFLFCEKSFELRSKWQNWEKSLRYHSKYYLFNIFFLFQGFQKWFYIKNMLKFKCFTAIFAYKDLKKNIQKWINILSNFCRFCLDPPRRQKRIYL